MSSGSCLGSSSKGYLLSQTTFSPTLDIYAEAIVFRTDTYHHARRSAGDEQHDRLLVEANGRLIETRQGMGHLNHGMVMAFKD
jgi:hypothetical protein